MLTKAPPMPILACEPVCEDEAYLASQLITYLGNKRALLDFIGQGVEMVRTRLGKRRLSTLDLFSGSGVVARYLKRFSHRLVVNDIERYAWVINRCYLANRSAVEHVALDDWFQWLENRLGERDLCEGFLAQMYAPRDMNAIRQGERCFYTPRNARFLDTARCLMDEVPEALRPFFLGPLLSEASIHANTSGVFKGFYKNAETGKGEFGGRGHNALERILGDIRLMRPVFSRFESDVDIRCADANALAGSLDEVDLAYIDPPYNQHPYGSNYFMLNLLVDYVRPDQVSTVSGIAQGWNRSAYNKRHRAWDAMRALVRNVNARFLLISFNSEGFIPQHEMLSMLRAVGRTEVLQTRYNAFKGSRNLSGRELHVTEYLYLVEKS